MIHVSRIGKREMWAGIALLVLLLFAWRGLLHRPAAAASAQGGAADRGRYRRR